MSDLFDEMQRHQARLESALSGAPEFNDREAIRSVVRRRAARRTAQSVASVAAVVVIGGGAWFATTLAAPGPDPAGPDLPHATDAAPSPSAPALPAIRTTGCPGRGEALTVDQAEAMSLEPQTGERWLKDPEPIPSDAPPAWASPDDQADWYRVGDRGDRTLYAGYDYMMGVSLVEVAPDGTATLLGRPFPQQQDPTSAGMVGAIAVDNELCLDSLALPASIDAANDGAITVHATTTAVQPQRAGDAAESTLSTGASAVFRITEAFDLSLFAPPSDVAQPTGVTYEIALPFGGWMTLASFDPLAGVATVAPGTWVDYFDLSCGAGPTFAAHIDDDGEPWTTIGALASGQQIAAPAADNAYARERYAAYAAAFTGRGDEVMSYEEWLARPGLVAVRASDGGWWLGIDAEASPRAWC